MSHKLSRHFSEISPSSAVLAYDRILPEQQDIPLKFLKKDLEAHFTSKILEKNSSPAQYHFVREI